MKTLLLALMVALFAPALASAQSTATPQSRLIWNLAIGSLVEVEGYQYFIYVDADQPVLAQNVTCINAAGAPNTVECRGDLPKMSVGVHTLTLTAATTINNVPYESAKADPPLSLRMIVVVTPTNLRIVSQ
jgi:hypothetical protein